MQNKKRRQLLELGEMRFEVVSDPTRTPALIGHVDWIIASFATQLARFSPGTILNEHCLKFALERGLNVESGAGNEENKRFWSRNDAHETVNFRIALSPWGAVGERAARLAIKGRARLKDRRVRTTEGSTQEHEADGVGDVSGARA